MTVVQYGAPPPLPASQPGDELELGPRGWVARLRAAAEIAGHIAQTDFVPSTLRGNPAAIAAAILYGDEVGLTPMQSLAKIAVIKGRPTLTAEAQRALITAAGHEIWFEESTVTRAIAAGRRAGQERIGRITWTLDDAKRAGIAGGENWRRYPAEMLRARASAALARAMFADVLGGMPALEEMQDEPGNGLVAAPVSPPPADAPTPAPTGRTRRRRPEAPPVPPAAAPLPPTPPADTQPVPPMPPEPGVTDAQKRQIFALMRDVGLQTAERDDRLGYTRRIINRPELQSSNELTFNEASLVIDDLKQIAAMPPADRPGRLVGQHEAALIAELEHELDARPVTAEEPAPQAGQLELARAERLQTLFEEKQIGPDERHAYARGVVNRDFTTLSDLTPEEASAVIAHLEQYDPNDQQTWPFPEGF